MGHLGSVPVVDRKAVGASKCGVGHGGVKEVPSEGRHAPDSLLPVLSCIGK